MTIVSCLGTVLSELRDESMLLSMAILWSDYWEISIEFPAPMVPIDLTPNFWSPNDYNNGYMKSLITRRQ